MEPMEFTIAIGMIVLGIVAIIAGLMLLLI
jgi:hypothetical protein